MPGKNTTVQKPVLLVIEPENSTRKELGKIAGECGYEVLDYGYPKEAIPPLVTKDIDLVISTVDLTGIDGLKFLEGFRERSPRQPKWLFLTDAEHTVSPEDLQRTGAIGVIQKPFVQSNIVKILDRIAALRLDPIFEIMQKIQDITGVKLGPEKKLFVETRLLRRVRALGLSTLSEYLELFKKNPHTELQELISLVTTHTTYFFRESRHFDYLLEEVFPTWKADQNYVIWSAACSTGEEVYSLAIAWLEFLKSRGQLQRAKQAKFIGTDVDPKAIQKAKEGIYRKENMKKVHPRLVQNYFDAGSEELEGLYRIKSQVYDLCDFSPLNLLDEKYSVSQADIIFLRNTLFYLGTEDCQNILNKIEKTLSKTGLLFLGHSESLSHLSKNYQSKGNSIYRHSGPDAKPQDKAQEKPIRVLVVDDSPTIRSVLKRCLSKEHGFEVIGEASTPIQADHLMSKLKPDVMTLDIHMPEVDGITYLENLRHQFHPPVVIISSIGYQDASLGLKCFEMGAVDYIEKPNGRNLSEEADRIREVVRGAAKSKPVVSKPNAEEAASTKTSTGAPREVIVIGSSTGGPEALKVLLKMFPITSPPILLVQHLPGQFASTFVERLNQDCPLRVKLAEDKEKLKRGHIYLAPGSKHLKVISEGLVLKTELVDWAEVNGHKPSVDVLFNSAAALKAPFRVVASLLTGMGKDGAMGLKKLKDQGHFTIAQNEETSVVFGMPKEAIELGGATKVLPLTSIAFHIFEFLNQTDEKPGA